MPTQGISLYFTIQDGGSSVLKAIGDQTKSLDKETQSLAQAYAALDAANKPLISRQSELKTALEKSAATVKDAKKAFQELGDEASELKMTEAIAEQDALKRELKDVESQLKSNQSTLNSYRENLRKSSVEAEGIGSSGTSVLSSLGQAGLWKALGGVASELGSAFVSSAYGDEGSTMFGSVLSSAGTGAAIGTMLGGPIGTAIGAALGGIVGAVQGNARIAQAKDDAFIEYYNGLYDDVSALAPATVSSGSTIAGGRETDLISFTTLLGDKSRATEFLSGLVDMSNSTPFLYDDLTAMSKTLATYGFKDQLGEGEDGFEILDSLQKVGDAGAALGMATSDMTSVATALGRMLSSDKASLEYLNIINERGVNAISMLAEARGKSVADTYTDISKSAITGSEAVEIILAGMEKSFSGSMEKQSKTFEGLSSTLEGLQQEVENSAGEGYNALRTEGIQAQINALGGNLGDAMAEINAIIGENQAYMENLSDQYQRDALSAVLLGEQSNLFTSAQTETLNDMHQQYEQWAAKYEEGNEEAGLHMQSLYEQAQALATAYYESSETYQTMQNVELDQIAAIRENTAGLAAATNAYALAKEQSKGQAATSLNGAIFDRNGNLTDEAAYWSSLAERDLEMWGYGNAYGLDRVPYDEYPALLHEGERVLTAQEARALDATVSKSSIQVTITGNNFTGSTVEMADQLAEVIVRNLEQAAAVAVPR